MSKKSRTRVVPSRTFLTKEEQTTFLNSIPWDTDPHQFERRAPLRVALAAFKCAMSALGARTIQQDLRWFKEEVARISGPYLPPIPPPMASSTTISRASSESLSRISSWSGSR